MVREKSCGAVVYAHKDGQRLYLVEHMKKGHTSICKGHVERGEKEHDTAAREIMEETGLEVRFIGGFRHTIRYSPYEGCVKDVVFFLAESETLDVHPQPEEVSTLEWLPYDGALTVLTHISDRETVMAAERFILAHPGCVPFRPMRRAARQMSDDDCRELLGRCISGVLAVTGDGGYPYAVPLSYVFDGGKIYFHGAQTGEKLDAIRADGRCSFCVVDKDEPVPEKYTTRYRSVIVTGRTRVIEDPAERRRTVELLARKYYPEDTQEHRDMYIDDEFMALAMFELTPERITGKQN